MDEDDQRIEAWYALCKHPLFEDCFRTGDTLLKEMLTKLDRLHNSAVHPRDALPSVYEVEGGVKVQLSFFPPPEPADQYLRVARRYLAVHEHFKAIPPVDEALVRAVIPALPGHMSRKDAEDVARRLVADGWKREAGS